jgi:hypothetical protein
VRLLRSVKNVKYFFIEDGTFDIAVYSTSVHYNKDGKWTDIDNTLLETKDSENNDVLVNKENDLKVKIAIHRVLAVQERDM